MPFSIIFTKTLHLGVSIACEGQAALAGGATAAATWWSSPSWAHTKAAASAETVEVEPEAKEAIEVVEDGEVKTQDAAADDEKDIRPDFEALVLRVQQEICDAISGLDGHKFRVDEWERPNNRGIGKSCVLQDGNVFEKAGVNVSVVKGPLPPAAVSQMRSRGKPLREGAKPNFYAAGISLVIHPHNPMAPTVHLNYRFFQVEDPETKEKSWWFGGGADLTPSYLFEEDAVEFHSALKAACDKHDPTYFDRFKKWCDEYFYIKHRKESRGIGGIFFDDLDERPANSVSRKDLTDREAIMAFSKDCLESFVPTYISIMKRRKDMPFTPEQKEWQQLRRGRYVEFNLVLDRGTKFGLSTPDNARIESILVSLPLTARWEYMHEPEEGTEEAKIMDVVRNPRDWAVDLKELEDASFQEIMAELARRSEAEAEAAK
ncbi:Oxygen-dependent coproporphyrinogen-III oxidase [Hondaea fermentalgiana]|uniref:coproporphyrinogen oxidase n=1 Tax=Hondaea fermentalgiana TaxID=2315210 RepID=A0A2R5GNN5_9STRA|nr:Oxygen-dependent coproporphyrinogen-III oxidase [Hondaea fermentalgiana]|eukprot:GBG32506.1 Oxygen-dependent coproporphyrinogen-III oxidase [Hondaea fermentalgiana]